MEYLVFRDDPFYSWNASFSFQGTPATKQAFQKTVKAPVWLSLQAIHNIDVIKTNHTHTLCFQKIGKTVAKPTKKQKGYIYLGELYFSQVVPKMYGISNKRNYFVVLTSEPPPHWYPKG